MDYHPAISFVAPYRIYLPDEFFEVLVGGSSARVKAVPLPSIATTSDAQVQGRNVEVLHDIFGFAGRTMFYVVLGESVDISDPGWKQDICARDHEIVASALCVVNRVVAVYRNLDVNRIGVPSFHAIELVRGDLSDISLFVVDEEFNQISDFAVTWPGYRTIGFGEAVTREAKIVDTIRTCLASGTEIPIERELLSSARNHHWRQQLRLVPVEANTSFESYVFSALKRVAPGAFLPDSINLVKKLQELDSLFAMAAAKNSKTFSRWFEPAVQGWKGLNCAVLKNWYSGCYELRNRVIHEGYNAVTDGEADAAIKHTMAAISMIEGYCDNLIP